MAQQAKYNTSTAWDKFCDAKRKWNKVFSQAGLSFRDRICQLNDLVVEMEKAMANFTKEDWKAWYEQ